MCGICGIINIKGGCAKQYLAAVSKMSEAMTHRGPNDSGISTIGASCFGHRRLSILDTSENGRQPFISSDGAISLVANGEIYNYIEYKDELQNKGYQFKSNSDSEVLLGAYQLESDCFLQKIKGMFAFAIHDTEKQVSILVRDRQGIKPLYYTVAGGLLIFASELGALLASGMVSRKIDPFVLSQYLIFGYVPEPDSLVSGIKLLMPGHYLKVEDGEIKTRSYWNRPKLLEHKVSDEEMLATVRHHLENSIKSHLQSDVELGVFLSGGVDSTIITALSRYVTSSPIKTFSMGFGEEGSLIDETSLATRIASFYKTKHHELRVTGSDVRDELSNIISAMSQPSFDGVNSYFISKAAHDAGVSVALSGLGGDELFGGYGSYDFLPKWGRYLNIWKLLNGNVKWLIINMLKYGTANEYHRQKILRLLDVSDFTSLYVMLRASGWFTDLPSLFSDSYLQSKVKYDNSRILECLRSKNKEYDLWQKTQELEMKAYMQWRLLRDTDAMSMSHSLEVRVPLLDDDLVEYVLGLPSGWEKGLGWPKKLLTNSVKDILPDFIFNRKKQGFQLPMKHWMMTSLKTVVGDTLSDQSISMREIFNNKELNKMHKLFLEGRYPYEVIWKFVVLEMWMRDNKCHI